MKLTPNQSLVLAAIGRGEVSQVRFGYAAWRVWGASPTVVGRLIHTLGLAEWSRNTREDPDTVPCVLTEAGRQALQTGEADRG